MTDQPAPRNWKHLIRGPEMLIGETVAPGVTRFCEAILNPGDRSFFYLVEGGERDCLIDGGWGFCHSLDAARENPGKPLISIATHSHFDHIGMLHLAGLRLGHPAEASVFAHPDPIRTQALPFLAGSPVLIARVCLEPASIEQTPCPLSQTIREGAEIDLGGVALRCLHTPGHSPGSLTLVLEKHGLLFCSDTVHDGRIYDDIPDADRADLARSHRRLSEIDFRLACPGHGAVLGRAEALGVIEAYRRRLELRAVA
jgi:glyoxylase-like metal-dependent hydrolase (beta-lactamase superfamily II)